jgi:uncharacterized damage-inducible protein DinB
LSADNVTPTDPVKRLLLTALSGIQSHVPVNQCLDGMPWTLAGEFPSGCPHSIFQIINHLVYWQDIARQYLSDEIPQMPEHAVDGWPGAVGPRDEGEWTATQERFQAGLEWVERFVRKEDLTAPVPAWPSKDLARMGLVQLVATHNSYHMGQIVTLRREQGSWPPPGGGDTW